MAISAPALESGAPTTLATLATLWAFTAVALLVILTRLCWRHRRREPFFAEDLWMAFAIVPLLARLACAHSAAVNSTVYFDRAAHPPDRMAAAEIQRRILGSKMILPGRICYAGFLWCMKVCILIWLEKVTGREQPYGRAITAVYVLVATSFVGVVLSSLLECRPFALYWQVWPDPGDCVKASVQLVTMGVLNIATDLCLMVIPLPLIYRARLPMLRKIQLALLFCVSIFVVSITVVRMPVIFDDSVAQKSRTLWASIEVMAACLVANAPVFNSFLHTVRQRQRSYAEHQAPPRPAGGGRRVRMPVTGQDSFGSLTRNEGADSQAEVEDWRGELVPSPPGGAPWKSGEEVAGGDGGGGGPQNGSTTSWKDEEIAVPPLATPRSGRKDGEAVTLVLLPSLTPPPPPPPPPPVGWAAGGGAGV